MLTIILHLLFAPAQVTDLQATALTDSAVVLQWTEVRSSTTAIPRYVVRYDSLGKFQWSAEKDVVTTGCAAPIVGATATGGRLHACVLWDLAPNTAYQVQLVAYTGTLNSGAVFGPLSNIVTVTTAERIGPMLVSRPRFLIDTAFVDGIAVSTYPGIYKGRYPIHGSFNLGSYAITGYWGDSITARGYLLVTKP